MKMTDHFAKQLHTMRMNALPFPMARHFNRDEHYFLFASFSYSLYGNVSKKYSFRL